MNIGVRLGKIAKKAGGNLKTDKTDHGLAFIPHSNTSNQSLLKTGPDR